MPASRGFSRRGMGVVMFWFTAIVVVVLDQATKVAVRHLMPLGSPSRVLIPGVLDLYRVENTGAAFSIGEGATWLFVICAMVAFAVACILVWSNDLPYPLVLSLGCVAGGGAGNMIDRLAMGSVTDFLATSFMDFPVFNVADIFVTCGVAVSMLLSRTFPLTSSRAVSAVSTEAITLSVMPLFPIWTMVSAAAA